MKSNEIPNLLWFVICFEMQKKFLKVIPSQQLKNLDRAYNICECWQCFAMIDLLKVINLYNHESHE